VPPPGLVLYRNGRYSVVDHQAGTDPEAVAELDAEVVGYTPLASEAVAAVDRGEAEAAFLLRPVTVDEVRAVAERGEVMPQKSTYFYRSSSPACSSIPCDRLARTVPAAVRDVEGVLRELPGRAEREPVRRRGEGGDDTTEIDARAEEAVLRHFEDVSVVSEEVGELRRGGAHVVVVDPIDGSLNAKRGIPFFSLSVAIAGGWTMDDVQAGYVYDFGSREEWWAERGGGAFLNGEPLLELPKERIEILAFEATKTSYVAEQAAAMVGIAYRLRSWARSRCRSATSPPAGSTASAR